MSDSRDLLASASREQLLKDADAFEAKSGLAMHLAISREHVERFQRAAALLRAIALLAPRKAEMARSWWLDNGDLRWTVIADHDPERGLYSTAWGALASLLPPHPPTGANP